MGKPKNGRSINVVQRVVYKRERERESERET